MTAYKYGTLLRALEDDPHPENDTTEGDLHIKAGKHADGDQYEVLTQETIAVVEFETVAVYEADRRLSKHEMTEFVRDRAVEDEEVDLDDA